MWAISLIIVFNIDWSENSDNQEQNQTDDGLCGFTVSDQNMNTLYDITF